MKADYSETSQLRLKITQNEWVIIAPKRGSEKKKHDITAFTRKEKRIPSPRATCPFENPKQSGNKDPYFILSNSSDPKKWSVQVFENKFPIVSHDKKQNVSASKNIIQWSEEGYGYHDVVVTRDHNNNFSKLALKDAYNVVLSFWLRSRQIASDLRIQHTLIFHNWGAQAGASLFHPHYQIIGFPVIPTDMGRALEVARAYLKKEKKCVYCDLIAQAQKEKKRVIYENKGYIAFVPFASKEPFEVSIFPKKHSACFEGDEMFCSLELFAATLQNVLRMITKTLNDPDYNFFIRTAPVGKKEHQPSYHWHCEIVPKTNIDAGVELGVGIQVNPTLPEACASLLKKHQKK